jgi:DNA-binding transcriptional LysR family regulator
VLERHELEAFLVLAEELHFGRTAERMLVSTARVSQTISKLERRIGAPLFRRTSRRVELTPIGRELYDELKPAHDRIEAALARAEAAGRGITGTLRVGFVDAAGSQLLIGASDLFGRRHPDCQVQIREIALAESLASLRDGRVDLLLACLPNREPDLATGPALVTEAQLLAVPATHPYARRESIGEADLAGVALLGVPDVADPLRAARESRRTPGERSIHSGPRAATLQEALALVGSGQGAFPVGAHVRRYHPRPDVAYVVIDDAPPVRWGLYWPATGATARVLAFSQAASDLVTD